MLLGGFFPDGEERGRGWEEGLIGYVWILDSGEFLKRRLEGSISFLVRRRSGGKVCQHGAFRGARFEPLGTLFGSAAIDVMEGGNWVDKHLCHI